MLNQLTRFGLVLPSFTAFDKAMRIAMTNEDLQRENAHLRGLIQQLCIAAADLQFLSRRYANRRMTGAVEMHNEATRVLVALGVSLQPDEIDGQPNGTIWAQDGMEEFRLSPEHFDPGHQVAIGEVVPLRPRVHMDKALMAFVPADLHDRPNDAVMYIVGLLSKAQAKEHEENG